MRTRFVGRRAELDRLSDLVRESSAGEGRIVALAGEAGIGKTRLIAELADLAEGRGCNVLWSQMIEDPVAPPYTAWVLALRGALQQSDNETLRADLGNSAPYVADIVPELRERLGLDASQPKSDNETTTRFQVYDAVTRLLLTWAERRPLVILFDNLHLADQSSLRLLEYYVRHMHKSAALVIVAYRASELSPDHPMQPALERLTEVRGFEEMVLTGLERDEVGNLLDVALPSPPGAALVDAVHSRGDGNALFTCQVAATLAGQQFQSQDTLPDGPLGIPNSLNEMIAARFRTVQPEVLELLRSAAVIGRDFDASLLAGICNDDANQVAKRLEHASKPGIIESLAPGRFRFHHALFREALYGQHSASNRIDQHRAVADCLTTRFNDGEDVAASKIAHHWFETSRGGYRREAIDWCRRAAEEANAKHAYDEATVQIQRALQVVDLAEHRDQELRFELLTALANYHNLAGDSGASIGAWMKSSVLAYRKTWPKRLAFAVLSWQQVRYTTGLTHISAVPLHQAALEMLPPDQQALRAKILASLATALHDSNDTQRAQELLYESVELARKVGQPEVLYACLIMSFGVFRRSFDATKQLAMLEEAVDCTRQIGEESNELFAMTALICPLTKLGRINETKQIVADFLSRENVATQSYNRNYVAGYKVQVAILEGRWNDALKTANESWQQESMAAAAGVDGRFGFQMFTIYRALGALGKVAPLLLRVSDWSTEGRVWLPGQIVLHCELDQKEEARKALDALGELEQLALDDLYETSLVYLTDACLMLGDLHRCETLFELLEPYRGFNLIMFGTLVHGAASGYLAVLAAALRRSDLARELFEEALQFNFDMGAHSLLVRTQVDYGQFLLASGKEKDRGKALELLTKARNVSKSLSMQKLLLRIDALLSTNRDHRALTKRELDVLQLVAAGNSNKRIADKLNVSLPTVATHVRHILRKTGASNRMEAVAHARENALLPAD